MGRCYNGNAKEVKFSDWKRCKRSRNSRTQKDVRFGFLSFNFIFTRCCYFRGNGMFGRGIFKYQRCNRRQPTA